MNEKLEQLPDPEPQEPTELDQILAEWDAEIEAEKERILEGRNVNAG